MKRSRCEEHVIPWECLPIMLSMLVMQAEAGDPGSAFSRFPHGGSGLFLESCSLMIWATTHCLTGMLASSMFTSSRNGACRTYRCVKMKRKKFFSDGRDFLGCQGAVESGRTDEWFHGKP